MKITKAQLKKLIKEALEDRINPDDDDLEQAGFRPVPEEGKRMVYVVFESTADNEFSDARERRIDAIFDSKEKAIAHIEDYGYSERDRDAYISQTIEEHELE